jgi:mannosyl-oligosaccharide alpha-1,2-mannosidase
MSGERQEASENTLVAEIGSLTLEFTRLAQLTEDPKYYDAIQRIMVRFDEQQNTGRLPGMWPVVVNAKSQEFNINDGFTLGGMADSLYEYLPKVSLQPSDELTDVNFVSTTCY